jgi:hypothetical protein
MSFSRFLTHFRKAQDYYIKDLCLNTRRFDSWAGLTVIEFYKIEELIMVRRTFTFLSLSEMLDVSRRMISILVSSIFTWQRRVTFVKLSPSTVTIIHSGWNMPRSPTFSNPTVPNMSVDECSLNPIRSDCCLERQSYCLCS